MIDTFINIFGYIMSIPYLYIINYIEVSQPETNWFYLID